MRRHSIPALALLAITLVITLALAPVARAQDCAEGRVSTPETAGRCCWPAQSWSEEHGRCSGPPQCPTGLVAEGDRCVVPILSFPPMPGSYAPGSTDPLAEGASIATTIAPAGSPPEATSWPPSPPGLEHALRDPRVVRGTDEPLLLAGLLTFGAAYVASIVFALADEAAQNCFSFTPGISRPVACGSWGYAFIPLAGGLMSGFTHEAPNSFRANVALAFGAQLPLTMLQILGVVIAAIADFGYTEDVVSGRGSDDVQVSIAPHLSISDGSASEGGVWLDVRF